MTNRSAIKYLIADLGQYQYKYPLSNWHNITPKQGERIDTIVFRFYKFALN